MCSLQEKAVRVREEALAIREATLELKEKLATSTSAAKSEQDRQVLHPCLACCFWNTTTVRISLMAA
jgi:hypothetical protein